MWTVFGGFPHLCTYAQASLQLCRFARLSKLLHRNIVPPQNSNTEVGEQPTMFDTNDTQKGLLIYLAEAAHELATAARTTTGNYSVALMAEAEELMTIRSNIIHRGAQLELPLEARKAA